MNAKRNQLNWAVHCGSAVALTILMLIIWNLVSDENAGFAGVVISFVIAAVATASLWIALVWGDKLSMRLRIAGSLAFDEALDLLFAAQARTTGQTDTRPFYARKHDYLQAHGGISDVLGYIQKTGQLPGLSTETEETPQKELDMINYLTTQALKAR